MNWEHPVYRESLIRVESGCADDRAPRSAVARNADMIQKKADVSGTVSTEIQPETQTAAGGSVFYAAGRSSVALRPPSAESVRLTDPP